MVAPKKNMVINVIGMKRSGNHAIISFFGNNSGRIDLTKKRHNDVWAPEYIVPKRGKKSKLQVEAPAEGNGLLMVSYEDVPIYDVADIPSFREADQLVDDAEIATALIIRNPYNLIASKITTLRNAGWRSSFWV